MAGPARSTLVRIGDEVSKWQCPKLANEDTTAKILELIGQRGRQEAPAGAAPDANDSAERRVLFTRSTT
jgi:hypothetical protein